MPRLIRLLPALGAFFVLVIALAACGDSVPGNAVATVGGDAITRAEFTHWMGIASAQSAPQGASPSSKPVYDPPNFTACVAKLRASSPKPAKGQPKPNDVAFKAQCKQQYEGLRDQVIHFLINERWIRGEAADQGIKLSGKQLDAQFAKIRKQSFPKDADFQKFLKNASMTIDDAKLQVGVNTLSTKLGQKVTKDTPPITNQRIVAYYNKNKARFAQPEKRDVRIVLAKAKAKADQARAALQHGQSWKVVAKRFSTDPGSKANGGAVKGLPKGQQDQTLDNAIFGAAKGKLVGPIKTQFGYYVIQVQKIVAPQKQSLKQATPMIKQQLQADGQRAAVTKFEKDLTKKWKAKTNCRAGFVTQDCKNAPKQKTTALAPGQAQPAPQQQQPGQAQPAPQQQQPGQAQPAPQQQQPGQAQPTPQQP